MNKTELLGKLSADPEERLLLARALDKLELCRTRNIPAHTQFLSLTEQAAAERLIAASGHPAHFFWGGFGDAERKLCVFLPDWMSPEDWRLDADCPLSAVRIACPPGCGLTHRDYLGSILGLGITREKVGDLLVGEEGCQAVLLRELEHVLLSQLDQVGRQRVRVSPMAPADLTPPVRQVKQIRDTVATLRLDAVVSSGFSLARSKAASLIQTGKVSVNHRECLKADKLVEEGDVLTCRGLGKCVLTAVLGQSRKGRTMIELERYV